MSRFDAGRRGRIAVWTGAALAWGTAVTMAGLEPVQAGTDSAEPPPSVATGVTVVGSVPTMPDRGLVVIRFQPSVAAAPEVRTVYVQQAAPQSPTRSVASTAAPAAPAPKSSGS